jgi:hypothetical protein
MKPTRYKQLEATAGMAQPRRTAHLRPLARDLIDGAGSSSDAAQGREDGSQP